MKGISRYLPVMLFLCVATALHGTPLTSAEALARQDGGGRRAASVAAPSLAETVNTTGGQPVCYAFDNPGGGFMLLAADSRMPALLGYSDAGAWNASDVPDGLRWLLEEYARELECGLSGDATAEYPEGEVAPMLTTKWNQNAPYNSLCPKVGGYPCVTGCVATALAQIMRYHQWPPRGIGQNEYEWEDTVLSLDFSTIEFDWENMPDKSSATDTEAQREAVALLNYVCGIAVNMDYGRSASGASLSSMYVGLLNNFDYDKGMRYADRDVYTTAQWVELLHGELIAGRPVLYTGASGDGSHAFVCDGYSGNGYFHINWGWGGMSDGYFLLTALDPAVQGIGGSAGGFNYGQLALCGIRPSRPDSHFEDVVSQYTFNILSRRVAPGERIEVASGPINISVTEIDCVPGIKFASADGGEIAYSAGEGELLAPFKNMGKWDCALPENLKDGEYVATPVFRNGNDGEWKDVPIYRTGIREATITVSGGIADISGGEPNWPVMEDVVLVSPMYANCHFMAEGEIAANAGRDCYCTVYGALYSDGEVYALGGGKMFDLCGGERERFSYYSRFKDLEGNAIDTGDYEFCFVVESDLESYAPITPMLPVTLKECGVTELLGSLSLPNGGVVCYDSDPLTLNISVGCLAGFYDTHFKVNLYSIDDSQVFTLLADATTPKIFLEAGDQRTVQVEMPVSVVSGTRLAASLFADYGSGFRQLGERFNFSSGTLSIQSEREDPEKIVYYNLLGVPVDGSYHGVKVRRNIKEL